MPRVVRFDRFEVDLSLGQLRKGNLRVHVREQSFQVLAALLERPGEVVTRDELRRRLWSDTVFVDFENSLNTAVGRLREALGESAARPRFIETLPRRGYRFIGSVVPPSPNRTAAIPRPRLLVLPLVNVGGDPAREYLSDAMTDEIITALAALAPQHLAVIARTTAMRYKHSRKDVARIGREVGVDYVVEGAVRHAGEQVAVNIQLVQVSDQTHLSAKRYDAAPGAVFDMQTLIAKEIGEHIPSLAGRVRSGQARRKPTENLEAYHKYIRARFEMWKWTPEGVAKARQHFEAALGFDPRFALACDGLANLYGYLGMWGFLPPDEAEPLRWFYGMRAAELDPTLAEPRTHVAYHPQKTRYEDAYSYNWVDAERGMAAARDLDPSSPIIRARHSAVLLVLGDMAQATAELQCALEFDPLSPEVHFWLAWVLFLARDHERALAQAQTFVDLEPRQPFAHMTLGHAYLGMRRFDESAAAFRKAADMSAEFPLVLGWLGLALGLGGRAGEARVVLERLRAIASERFVLPTSFAWLHLGLGEVDNAFEWMARAVDHNDEWIHPLKTYPFLDPLRDDPRFGVLLKKLSLEADSA
jgi:TolB-like protein/Flp pilus assembly protein TadD